MADPSMLEESRLRGKLGACEEALRRLMGDALAAGDALDRIDWDGAPLEDVEDVQDRLCDAVYAARQAWVAWSKGDG